MNSPLCVVEIASYHGRTNQKRWERCFRAPTRAECHQFVDRIVKLVVADDPLTSLIAQQHARDHFRVYSLRSGL